MKSKILFIFSFFAIVYGSEIPDFQELSNSKGVVFFLSTPRSGTNVILGSLSAITRKPISWVDWGPKPYKFHPSYNRVHLPLITNQPLLYRTHDILELEQIRPSANKLIFATRNPKELIYRQFFLFSKTFNDPDQKFIKKFLDQYLETLRFYDRWQAKNRFIIFYEDFIKKSNEILLEVLKFMKEDARFFDDFKMNKRRYLSEILTSYSMQHEDVNGGVSSIRGPKAIYYTKDASTETLQYIDQYIQKMAPRLWEKYLKRYQSSI